MQEMIEQKITLLNREKLTVTGVTDVDAFDENKIVLYTDDDTILIEGNNLHLQKLDIADGDLIINGEICAFSFSGKGEKEKTNGFFRRLVK